MAHRTCVLLSIFLFPILVAAISNCRGHCDSGTDCSGQLTCIRGKCNDDPIVGTNICSSGSTKSPKPPSGGGGGGRGGGGRGGGVFPATLTNNDFSEGSDGGGPSACDGHFHSNKERVVALSTRWFAGGSRCGKMIRITTKSGKFTTAKVVDECDTPNDGCGNSIVDASNAVWHDLELDIDVGEVPVTWSLA